MNGGYAMNEKFFSLPKEKQQAILNAGYRVFSQNTYKNSPMSEIAEAAGISKSLLFYYFHNKKEFYLFLWDICAQTTIDFLTKFNCYNQTDLFESMERGIFADKARLNFDSDQFIPGLDITMMYQEMYWASEGYLWEKVQQGNIDYQELEKDFTKLLKFWKSVYLRKE